MARQSPPTLFADLGATAVMAIFIAAMCVAWLAPLELIVPRPR